MKKQSLNALTVLERVRCCSFFCVSLDYFGVFSRQKNDTSLNLVACLSGKRAARAAPTTINNDTMRERPPHLAENLWFFTGNNKKE